MAKSFINTHEAARVVGLTSQIDEATEQMLTAGQWPPSKPTPVFKYEDEEYRSTVHWDRETSEWVLRRINKTQDETEVVFRAPTRSELTMLMAAANAAQELENTAVARENFSVDAGLPEGIYKEEDTTPSQREFYNWTTQYRNGQEYLATVETLGGSARVAMYNGLMWALKLLKLPQTANNLALAYDQLLDENEEFYSFKKAAEAERVRHLSDAQIQAREAEKDAQRQLPVERPPYSQTANPEVVARRAEDVGNKGLNDKELRAAYLKTLSYGPGRRS